MTHTSRARAVTVDESLSPAMPFADAGLTAQTTRSRRTVAARVAGCSVLALGLVMPVALSAGAATPAGTSLSAGSVSSSVAAASKRKPKPVTNKLPKVATMTGAGGAVASVDPVASQVGIDVLKSGGNAADAAIATAAALGVVEPFANGIGGGGFFVYYDKKSGKVSTLDGREAAPAGMNERSFLNPDGTPMDFETAVASGLSVGVPGTPAVWDAALRTWGTRSFKQTLAPAQKIAERGFIVDDAFSQAVADNAGKLSKFPASAKVFLPGGKPVQPGQVLRQTDLAKSYGMLRKQGISALYRGALGKAIVQAVQHPKTAAGVNVASGSMTMADLAAYRVNRKAPIHSTYRGYDVYGMPQPSSGGIAVAESLNLLEAYAKKTGQATNKVSSAQYLHRFAEATATSFADRNRWVGDIAGVPVKELISKGFAAERACGFNPTKAQARPIAFGQPDGSYGACAPTVAAAPGKVNDGQATTHLTVADKWGNVASYTLTIEQWAGSGMVVPGYGFLLNNEMTDFNFAPMTPGVPDPNLPAPGKRPRSSMSPTIILKDGRPFLAAGAAGGSTIITTTLQIITGVIDRDLAPVAAVAAPRISSRNTGATAEPSLILSEDGKQLAAWGQPMTPTDGIGRATAIRILGGNRFTPAAETTRGGGGSAMVVKIDKKNRR